MKHISTLLMAAFLMATTMVQAQAVLSQDDVLTLDGRAREYREGEVLVKFKDASAVKIRRAPNGALATSGVNAVDAAFAELGITELEELMPLSGAAPAPRRVKALNGNDVNIADMSRLYRIKLAAPTVETRDSHVSVHAAIEKLQALAEVEYAEPNYLVYAVQTVETPYMASQKDELQNIVSDNASLSPVGETGEGQDVTAVYTDPLGSQQWGLKAINLLQLWKAPIIQPKRPVIAIIDTGVDIEHPDLKDNIWTNEAEANGADKYDDDNNGFKDDLHGWDFVNQTGIMDDFNGHGTHCAGIAAATGNNGIGIAGANPEALIMPITVMQSDGVGDVATIIKGIDYAVANGADVLSMSFGGYTYSIAEEQALACAYNKAVLVAAAGNDGFCIYPNHCKLFTPGPMFPAAFAFVFGVEASANGGGLAGFSNFDCDGPLFFNPAYYGEEQMYNYELRAPGAGIYSTYPNGQYKTLSGTSMACPLAAGAISRLLQCKEYANQELLFGDLIHTRNGDIDVYAAYNITDEDRKPALSLVSYELQDTINGDGDQRPDNGETIAVYPILRNAWGQANNIRMWLTVGENEDTTIVTFLDNKVDFGAPLSSYAKNKAVNPIRFTVRDNCVDGRHIKLQLHATCDNMAGELTHDFTITVENGVEIGGVISEDMTLYPNVHYIVTSNLAIPKDVTLTLKPGTVLKFKDNTGLRCNGHLIAKGTPDSLITFTKTDLGYGYLKEFVGHYSTSYYNIADNDTLEYVLIKNFTAGSSGYMFQNIYCRYSIIADITPYQSFWLFLENSCLSYSLMHNNSLWSNGEYDHYDRFQLINSSLINTQFRSQSFTYDRFTTNDNNHKGITPNQNNIVGNRYRDETIFNIQGSEDVMIITPKSYFGSNREDIIRKGVYDIKRGYGYGEVDLSQRLTQPNPLAPPIVWKVLVNGYDAQDEFEQLPPLGVGKHKFEVYYSQPVDKSQTPMIAMGVRPPYTSISIAEEGSWNEAGDVYTAYLNLTGKMAADGLNRIYVSGGKGVGDYMSFEIPLENTRFNVQVAAAGSMSTGFAAETGIGKVTLTWENQDENIDDILGFNLYRYQMDTLNNKIDSLRLNTSLIDNSTTEFVDYDVTPGETYYYYYKILRTSLTENSPSRTVAATPLTATKGDANGTMTVDVADVVTEIGYMTGQNPQPFIFDAADVNSDLTVNILDVVGTINIILHPDGVGTAAVNDEAATYSIENGILYLNTPVALGGLQVSINAPQGTAFKTLDALTGFEQASTWNGDIYTFMAYSMVGQTLSAGKHAILEIGANSLTDIVLSDPTGRNVVAIAEATTGISNVTHMQLQGVYPNPFTDALTVDFAVGKSGVHKVELRFTDLAGRTIYAHSTTLSYGNHSYTWKPAQGLLSGIYFVTLYVDGTAQHTEKVVKM